MQPVRDLFGRAFAGLSAPSAEADADPSIGIWCVAARQAIAVGSAECLSEFYPR
jgi:hypothetical protein